MNRNPISGFGVMLMTCVLLMTSSLCAAPDLVVTDIWEGPGSTVIFQVRNVGPDLAGSVWGAGLVVNNMTIDMVNPNKALKSGERWEGIFSKDPGNSIVEISVEVDAQNAVNEVDEKNNDRTEWWKLPVAPSFCQGQPVVTEVGTQSAKISFFACNGPVTAQIRYGLTVSGDDFEWNSPGEGLDFSVLLKNLQAASVYRYVVEIEDAWGRTALSDEGFFRTNYVSDSNAPLASIPAPTRTAGVKKMHFVPKVTDDVGVDRVAFRLNKRLLGIDYTAPFEWEVGVEELTAPDEDQQMSIEAFDTFGNMTIQSSIFQYLHDPSGPEITLVEELPTSFEGLLEFAAEVTDMPEGLDRIAFYVDGGLRDEIECELFFPVERHTYNPVSYTAHFITSVYTEGVGEHGLTIRAEDSEGHISQIFRTVEYGEPVLHRPRFTLNSHPAGRIPASNAVVLVVNAEHTGDRHAESLRLTDYTLRGFQIIDASCEMIPSNPALRPTVKIEHAEEGSKVSLDTGLTDIAPGDSVRFEVIAVPVLNAPTMHVAQFVSGRVEYSGRTESGGTLGIGDWDLNILTPEMPPGYTNLQAIHREYTLGSDYIIMTSPEALYDLFAGGYLPVPYGLEALRPPVDELLTAMGVLASVRDGVVGFVDSSMTRQQISDLLQSGAAWGGVMNPGFTSEGYLLLVGETEILPADNITVDATYCPRFPVWPSDLKYGNTSGNSWHPELKVGRILGNTPDLMRVPIETSIHVARGDADGDFDLDKAIMYAGDGDGQSSFRGCISDLHDNATGVFSGLFPAREVSGSSLATQFNTDMADCDYIVYRGHGWMDSWSDVTDTGQVTAARLGSGNAVVTGWTCLSGEYEDPADPGYVGMGEDFIKSGAGTFVGAVEESPRGVNNTVATRFQNYWLDDHDDIGTALKRGKRSLTVDHYFSWDNYDNKRWCAEYNLYGDPKYGTDGLIWPLNTKSSEKLMRVLVPGSELILNIPDYEQASIGDGTYEINLPGQGALAVPGNPRVPIYMEPIEIPGGVQVLNVTLQSKSELTENSGVEVGLAVDAVDNDYGYTPASEEDWAAEDDTWWPPIDYTWSVENQDGVQALVLTAYPFKVLRSQADIEFYQKFTFVVETGEAETILMELRDPWTPVDPGENAQLELRIVNSGEAQDVYLAVDVMESGGATPVSELPTRLLNDLAGTCTLTLTIPTLGLASGMHDVRVRVFDLEDHALAMTEGSFTVTGSTIEVVEVGIDLPSVNTETAIDRYMHLRNAGTEATTGTAVMILRNAEGSELEQIAVPFGPLEPDEEVFVREDWAYAGHEGEIVVLMGYATYAQATSNIGNAMETMPAKNAADLKWLDEEL